MYLSRVELDPTRRSTMTALAAPQKFHGAVESAFSGERRRRLWRLDRLGEKLYLLLLSEEMPDLSGVVEQFGTGQPLAVSVGGQPHQKLQRRPKTRSAGNRGRTLHDTVPEAVAVGSRRKARLCPDGGFLYRDPSAVAPLCQARHPPGVAAGGDV